jgi:hypothetical protein
MACRRLQCRLLLSAAGRLCAAVQRVSRTLKPEMMMLKMKWDQCILWKSLHGRRAKENEAQVRFRCAAPRRNRGAQDGLWPQWLAWPLVANGVPTVHCSLSDRSIGCAALRRIRFACAAVCSCTACLAHR